jgi:hypothetical protein
VKEESSFLKKRSKKLLDYWCDAVPTVHLNEQKFFGSFFQKRTLSFCFG